MNYKIARVKSPLKIIICCDENHLDALVPLDLLQELQRKEITVDYGDIDLGEESDGRAFRT